MSNANKLEGDLLSSVNNLFLPFVLVIEDKDGSGNKLEQTACFCVTWGYFCISLDHEVTGFRQFVHQIQWHYDNKANFIWFGL